VKRLPFGTLFKIAYVAAHNYYVDLVENDEKSSIENIYFVIYNQSDYENAIDISKKLSSKKRKLNDFSSAKSQVLYLNSVKHHDNFIVMKVVRFMMLLIQFLMPGFWISHLA